MIESSAHDYSGKIGFDENLCYTDLLDLAERLESCYVEEISDWEDSVQSYNLTYN